MSPETSPELPPPVPQVAPRTSWFQRLSTILFVIFCFELGIFLILYPWMSAWNDNFFAWVVPVSMEKAWNEFWINPYFRGAISGIGFANIWIALTEIGRLFTRR